MASLFATRCRSAFAVPERAFRRRQEESSLPPNSVPLRCCPRGAAAAAAACSVSCPPKDAVESVLERRTAGLRLVRAQRRILRALLNFARPPNVLRLCVRAPCRDEWEPLAGERGQVSLEGVRRSGNVCSEDSFFRQRGEWIVGSHGGRSVQT